MAYQGVMDDIRACVELRVPSRVPVFALSEEFDVRMANQIYNEYNRNAKIMAEVQIQAINRYDYDWAWLQVDDCFEFEPLGVGCHGEGNILPATCESLPFTRETFHSLRMPNPKTDGRMPALLEAISRIKEHFGDTVCVTGRVTAPFSAVTLIYGMTETLFGLYDDPDLVRDTVKFMTEFECKFAQMQIEAGADALWVGDCNASGHLISVDNFNEFAADSVKTLAQTIRQAGGYSFYHASEHSIPHLKAQAETGVSAISIGPGLDVGTAKEAVGDRVCLMGNVDPIVTLLEGDAAAVREASERIMKKGMQNGGYIFSSGEMIPRDVPEENMIAMVETGRKFGRY